MESMTKTAAVIGMPCMQNKWRGVHPPTYIAAKVG